MTHSVPSDIAIAHAATLRPLVDVAADLGVRPEHLEPWGRDVAKIDLAVLDEPRSTPDAKYVVVTAVTPTPLGEGKTTTSVGLAQALQRLGKRAVVALRQPSMGPTFGIKGGAAGGGWSQVVPMERLNLHLTGDFHAVTVGAQPARGDGRQPPAPRQRPRPRRPQHDVAPGARRQRPGPAQRRHRPRRPPGRGGPRDRFRHHGGERGHGAPDPGTSLHDLRERLGRIVVGYTSEGSGVTAEDLHAAGAMAVLLVDALKPNLLQTLEGGPAIIHCGPFGNIATGTSSVTADLIAVARQRLRHHRGGLRGRHGRRALLRREVPGRRSARPTSRSSSPRCARSRRTRGGTDTRREGAAAGMLDGESRGRRGRAAEPAPAPRDRAPLRGPARRRHQRLPRRPRLRARRHPAPLRTASACARGHTPRRRGRGRGARARRGRHGGGRTSRPASASSMPSTCRSSRRSRRSRRRSTARTASTSARWRPGRSPTTSASVRRAARRHRQDAPVDLVGPDCAARRAAGGCPCVRCGLRSGPATSTRSAATCARCRACRALAERRAHRRRRRRSGDGAVVTPPRRRGTGRLGVTARGAPRVPPRG